MTSIAPQPSVPPGPAVSSRARGSPPPREGEIRFESLLAPLPPAEASPAVADEGRSSLDDGVAHLFNEFGFFAARLAHQFPSGEKIDDPFPAEARPEARPVIARAALDPVEASLGQPTAEAGDGVADELKPCGSGQELDGSAVGRSRQAGGRPAAQSPARSASAAEPLLLADARAEQASLSPDRGVRTGKATATDGVCGGSRPRAAGAAQSDRLLFRIGDHQVELAGRLADLREEDERRLLEALGELLEGHGLSLASATLNGRPVPLGRGRGES